MAIPKKGSRKIIVDDVEYRWYIRHKPTYSQLMGWSNLVVAVERTSEGLTSLLVVEMLQVRPDAIIGEHVILKPADVADYIRAALSAGW